MALIPITVQGTPWIADDVNLTLRRDEATSPLPDLTNPLDRVSAQQLYSAVQNRFDEPDLLDSDVPMSAQTPNAFRMINGWFIDETSLRYVTGGAITSVGWDGVIRKITFSAGGYIGPTVADLGLAVTQAGSGSTGTLVGFRNDTREWWVRVTLGGSPDNLFEQQSPAGVSIAGSASSPIPQGLQFGNSQTGEYRYTNAFTLGTIESNTSIAVFQAGTKVLPQFWGDGQIDILVKVRDSGNLIDSGRVFFYARQYSKTYDNFDADLSVGGRQPIPLATGDDLNNQTGYREVTFAQNSPELTLAQDDVLLDASGTKRAVVTSVQGTNLRYYLLDRVAATGDFNDLGLTSPQTVLTVSGKTGSISITSASREFGPGQATISPLDFWEAQTVPTISVGAVSQNLGTGTANAPYSITFNLQGATLAQFYEWLKHITMRNATQPGPGAGTSPADPVTVAFGQAGEQYIGKEANISFPTAISPTFQSGEIVTQTTTGATAVVLGNHQLSGEGNFITVRTIGPIAFDATVSPNTIVGGTSGASTAITAVTIVAPIKASPFGTFAGGTFFGAPGVFVTNMAAADVQNFQLIDDNGNVQVPPQAVAVTVRGLVVGDRVGVFRLDAPFPGGAIVRNRYTLAVNSPDNIAGATTLNVVATGLSPNQIQFDEPGSGVVKVRDISVPEEWRFRYDSFSGNLFNLTVVPGGAATAADATGTQLTDADSPQGQFVTNGVQIGDTIRNVTDGSAARVTEIVSETVLRHTPLAGGTGNDWGVADVYEINTLPFTFVNGTDTAYVMLLEVVATASVQTSDTLIFSTNIDAKVVVRFSSAIISPFEPIEPFETGATVTSGGLDVTAIRNDDDIATAA